MHLPDAFLDTKTILLTSGAAVTGVGYAVKRVQQAVEPRQVPLLGLAGAFVFAAQMLNFPLVGGTSGHLLGGVLTAILLGPSAAVLVITCVLIVQCLMFADGGLLALGANVFNMALVSVLCGYAAFRLCKRLVRRMDDRRGTVFAAAVAGWIGTVTGSISCAGQLALSGTAPWNVTFPAMANIHMLIGVGEGLATALIVLALGRMPAFRPAAIPENNSGVLLYGALITLGMVLFVAPFASPWPDGLEKVAESLGFGHRTSEPVLSSPMTDYQIPMLESASLGTAVAGAVGAVIVFFAAYLLARALVPGLQDKKDAAPTA